MNTFKVIKIEHQPDRVLLYKEVGRFPYYAIAKVDVKIEVGDIIEYDPCGFNFGWSIKKL